VVNHNLGLVPTTRQIADTGDFDGDNDSDILWRHDEGAVTIWEIEDTALVVNHNQPAVHTTWEVEGTHDFDSDGDDDILWRHDEGQVVTWEMQDLDFVVNHNFALTGNDWQISPYDGKAENALACQNAGKAQKFAPVRGSYGGLGLNVTIES